MAEKEQPMMLLSSSPHIASPVTVQLLMVRVLIALAPVSVFGIITFGLPALLTILVSVAAAMTAEALFRRITGQDIRVRDLSAAVSGLLLALVLPPSTPLWMTALGAAFAVIVAKEFFGGLGANVFNPALIGRAFLIMSFPAAITSWHQPGGFVLSPADAVSGVTPLNIIKQGGTIADVGADFLHAGLSSSADYWPVMKTLFIGNHGGCIGETSILLILAGAVYLLATKTIDWRAPLAMIVAAFIASLALGRDPLFSILSGGVVFGAVFMATDYVSAPLTARGKLIFGCGAGLITALIRQWGNYPEGVTYGILIMNAVTPFLNRLLQKKYGFVPKKKPPKAAKAGDDKGAAK
jgi:electron transport complex protein RnfD